MNTEDILLCADRKLLVTKFERFGLPRIPNLQGCWIWRGGYTRAGRAAMCVPNYRAYVHAARVVWFLYRGAIGDKLVCHTCDNMACVNPSHLFLGTAKDNMVDMARKGRGHDVIFTPDDVRVIRKDLRSVSEIAKAYGCSRGAIYGIVHRLTWAWLD